MKVEQDQIWVLRCLGYNLGRRKKWRTWELLWYDLMNGEVPLSHIPRDPENSAIPFEAGHGQTLVLKPSDDICVLSLKWKCCTQNILGLLWLHLVKLQECLGLPVVWQHCRSTMIHFYEQIFVHLFLLCEKPSSSTPATDYYVCPVSSPDNFSRHLLLLQGFLMELQPKHLSWVSRDLFFFVMREATAKWYHSLSTFLQGQASDRCTSP